MYDWLLEVNTKDLPSYTKAWNKDFDRQLDEQCWNSIWKSGLQISINVNIRGTAIKFCIMWYLSLRKTRSMAELGNCAQALTLTLTLLGSVISWVCCWPMKCLVTPQVWDSLKPTSVSGGEAQCPWDLHGAGIGFSGFRALSGRVANFSSACHKDSMIRILRLLLVLCSPLDSALRWVQITYLKSWILGMPFQTGKHE